MPQLTPTLGEKHNSFTLIDIEPQQKQHKANGLWYRFQCDCGEERIHLLTKVRQGRIKSCGCKNTGGKPRPYNCKGCGATNPEDFSKRAKETCKKCFNKQKAKAKESSVRVYLSSKTSKLKRQSQRLDEGEEIIDLDFLENLWNTQEGKCFYTDIPMTLKTHDLKSASIDRVDSAFGYIEGNVVLCCKGINLMKSTASFSETSLFLGAIVDNISEFQTQGEEWDIP